MKDKKRNSQNLSFSEYQQSKTTENYLHLIDPDILNSFSPEQKTEIINLIHKLTSTPSPKLVDLRFTIDLLITRYFVVILLGKDRRSRRRKYIPKTVSKVGNIATAIFILLCLNIFIIGVLLLGSYILKSALGINLFEGHVSDVIERILK